VYIKEAEEARFFVFFIPIWFPISSRIVAS
jgi:hypothetical protein